MLLIVTTGGPPVEKLGPLPPNVRAAEYLPYDKLFPQLDVMVTNGGYGGVHYALAHSVPLVVAGGGEDKPEGRPNRMVRHRSQPAHRTPEPRRSATPFGKSSTTPDTAPPPTQPPSKSRRRPGSTDSPTHNQSRPAPLNPPDTSVEIEQRVPFPSDLLHRDPPATCRHGGRSGVVGGTAFGHLSAAVTSRLSADSPAPASALVVVRDASYPALGRDGGSLARDRSRAARRDVRSSCRTVPGRSSGYPGALFERLVEAAKLRRGDRVLEVGPGPGKATLPLVRRGLQVTAVEPGAALAAQARANLAGHPVEVVNRRFEDWNSRPGEFAAVVAATAWHWLNPDLRYGRAARALRPDGHLASGVLSTYSP